MLAESIEKEKKIAGCKRENFRTLISIRLEESRLATDAGS